MTSQKGLTEDVEKLAVTGDISATSRGITKGYQGDISKGIMKALGVKKKQKASLKFRRKKVKSKLSRTPKLS